MKGKNAISVVPALAPDEAVVPEMPDVEPFTWSNAGDCVFQLGRLEEAIVAAIYFAGRVRKSIAQQAILSRLKFVQDELDKWMKCILTRNSASQAQKEGK
jgi:hypothetical protein